MQSRTFKKNHIDENTFVLSDLHFGHKNILGYCRPWFKSIEEHDEYIIKTWNEIVGPDDCAVILGDVTLKGSGLDSVGRLNGQKILIGGNHDNFSAKTYLEYFTDVAGVAQLNWEDKKVILTHIPIHPDQMRWDFNLHGHLHAYQVDDDRYISACCEPLSFKPIRIGMLISNRVNEVEDAE